MSPAVLDCIIVYATQVNGSLNINLYHCDVMISVVVYFHEQHVVREWVERMGPYLATSTGAGCSTGREGTVIGRDNYHIPVVACHDEPTARLAKLLGFPDVFYAKKRSTDGLTQTVLQAVEHAKKVSAEKAAATRKVTG